MNIDSYMFLTKNPFICSRFISSFIAGYNNDCPLSLSYLVLPLIFYEPMRNILINSDKIKDMESLIEREPTILIDFPERFKKYKNLTNQALIVAHNSGAILLSDFISKKENLADIKNLCYDDYFDQCLISAHRLGKIFKNESIYLKIFFKLNASPL